MPSLICHLIDANSDTAFFRSIAVKSDKIHFPVLIGSINPRGKLQEAMKTLKTATFSLETPDRKFYASAIKRLVDLLKKERVSVLHSHCFDPTLVGLISARIAGVKFVFTRHHSDHNIRIGAKWHTRIDSFCARRADHVIAVSQSTKQIMVEFENVPEDQITVIYNGMEQLRQPTIESLAATRNELGNLEGNIILLIGRLHEEKGHRYLFEALPKIIEKTGKTTVLLAGDGSHKEQIKAEAQRFGVIDQIKFLGQRTDIPELLKISSIVVMPSLAESFGFVALEAMSFGVPLVVSNAGGLTEVVKHGETGIIVEKANAELLADAICNVLQSSSQLMQLTENGIRRSSLFTFEKMISGYENIYKNILGDKFHKNKLVDN